MKQKLIPNQFLLIITMTIASTLHAPLPTSRDADFSESLSPCKIISINLLSQITDKLCDILDIKQYESTFKGGLGVCNLQGPNHDIPDTNCWDHPLHITDSDPIFEGVNIIRIKENIIFKPNANAACPVTTQQAAIIVEKDDMTIDLSGFTINMDGRNLTSNPSTCAADTGCTDPGCVPAVHGIHILPGVKNTRIISTQSENTHTRGSIKKFTGFGIYIEGNTGVGERVEEVFINNIRIYNCYNGIYAQNASNINITRSEANNNCNYSTVYGMQFVNVSDLYIVGSQASSNRSCNTIYGIYMQDTCNSFVEDTETSKNVSTTTSNTGSVYGMYVTATTATTSFANHIKNCKVSGNMCANTAASECTGIYLGGQSAHNIIDSCTVIANNFTDAVSPPNAYGIRLDSSNFNEITSNKVGFNANNAPTGSTNPGISDTDITGSTSLFTSNVSFFNGYQGSNNYDILFRKNTGGTESFKATIIYAANLEGVTTNTPSLGNLDVRKAP